MPGKLVQKKPVRANIGTLCAVEDPKPSKSGESITQEISIQPASGGKPRRYWLSLQSYMFSNTFNKRFKTKNDKFFYTNNIGCDVLPNGTISPCEEIKERKVPWIKNYVIPAIPALFGLDIKGYKEFETAIGSLPEDEVAFAVAEGLRTKIGTEVGYFEVQQSKSTNEIDDKGKPVYDLTPYYDIAGFFQPTKKVKEAIIKNSEKSADPDTGRLRFVVTFDDSEPFSQGSSSAF